MLRLVYKEKKTGKQIKQGNILLRNETNNTKIINIVIMKFKKMK